MAVAAQTMTGAPAPARTQQHAAERSTERERERERERAPQLPALTGLRAVAALVVVAYHFGGPALASALRPLGGLWGVPAHLLEQGYLGVNVFFVLSGFILTYSYTTAAGALRGTARAFWRARVARIYPLYVLALALAVPPLLLAGHDGSVYDALRTAHPAATLLAALALVQAWIPYGSELWNGPGWSLSVEAFFYLLFPALAAVLCRLGRGRLLVCLALAYALTLPLPVAVLLSHGHLTGPLAAYRELIPLTRLPEFVLGMAVGRLVLLRPGRPRSSGHRLSGAALLGVVSVAGVLLALLAPGAALAYGPLDLLVAALLYLLATDGGRGAVVRALSRPVMVRLGEASYALYILHWPLHDWLTHLAAPPDAGSPLVLPYFGAYVALCVGAALLCGRFVEAPARRVILRRGNAHARRRGQEDAPSGQQAA